MITKRTVLKWLAGAVVFATICGAAVWLVPHDRVAGHWTSIVPPLLAIVLAWVTQNVYFSLGTSILVGGILTQRAYLGAYVQPWIQGLKTSARVVGDVVRPFEDGAVAENMWILGFVFIIFAMVEVLIQCGGFQGVIRLLLSFVKGRRSAELITAALGTAVFIDDYTSSIVVGSAMRPVGDRYYISREKLAFLVDGTSAPIAGLAVISTWIAYEVGLFTDIAGTLGIEKSGYAMFFDALQYRFYCLLMIGFVYTHILVGCDFGPMRRAQLRCQELAADDAMEVTQAAGLARCALIPLLGLLLFHFAALWWAGGGLERYRMGGNPASWIYWRETISAVPSSSRILVYSSSVGLFLAVFTAWQFTSMRLGQILALALRGLTKGWVPASILVLAWSIKGCCDLLETGPFLSSLLVGSISPVFFPALVFLVACLTSFATGTSYGTMAILIPTAIPVAFGLDGNQYGLITMISLGAVLDGAIFGDHCSPISDTTILSSMSTGCDLMKHVRTQLPYGLLVAILALSCAYIPSAWGFSAVGGLGLAFGIMVSLLLVLRFFQRHIHSPK